MWHSRVSLKTWNCSQVGVNREQILIGHVMECGPRHDLKPGAVERKRNALAIRNGSAVWMRIVEVFAGSQDRDKVGKCVPLRQSEFVRCQVARYNVSKGALRRKRAVVVAATQIVARVDLRFATEKRGQKIRVAAGSVAERIDELSGGACRVASVAVPDGIDQIASHSNQRTIFPREVQRYRRDGEALLDLRFIIA